MSPKAIHTKTRHEQALDIIAGERRRSYGSVESSFHRISLVFSAILNVEVTSTQVALMMAALKLCREANEHASDNIIDFYGYIELYERLLQVEDA